MEVREPSAKYLSDSQFRQTELGCFPATWELNPLAALATKIGSGKTPSGGSSRYREYGRPFVRSQNIGWGNLLLADLQHIDDATHAEFPATEILLGDVLLNITGASIGRSAVAAETLVGGNVNQHVCIIRPGDADPRLLNYFLLSPIGQRQIDSFQAGGNRQGLNFSQVASIRVPMPPTRDEQRAIAAALSDSDALIDSLEQLLTKKRQIKQGAMQELLTGKRRLPGFSGQWQPLTMGDLFDFSGGLSASRDQLGSVGACYLHYGDIHLSNKTYIDLDSEHHEMPRLDVDVRKVNSSALLKNGDVVFVDASEDDEGVSKHVVIHSGEDRPLISGLHTIVARPKTEDLVDIYKRYCFQAPEVHAQFRFYAVGTKVSGVSKGNIGKIVLNVPSTEEQTEIAACLCSMDSEITWIEARLTKARNLKQAMAQALLTGRIRLVAPQA